MSHNIDVAIRNMPLRTWGQIRVTTHQKHRKHVTREFRRHSYRNPLTRHLVLLVQFLSTHLLNVYHIVMTKPSNNLEPGTQRPLLLNRSSTASLHSNSGGSVQSRSDSSQASSAADQRRRLVELITSAIQIVQHEGDVEEEKEPDEVGPDGSSDWYP